MVTLYGWLRPSAVGEFSASWRERSRGDPRQKFRAGDSGFVHNFDLFASSCGPPCFTSRPIRCVCLPFALNRQLRGAEPNMYSCTDTHTCTCTYTYAHCGRPLASSLFGCSPLQEGSGGLVAMEYHGNQFLKPCSEFFCSLEALMR